MAPYYDGIMSHVDYGNWANYIKRIWKRFGFKPGNILELACGTCPFAAIFSQSNTMVFLDNSFNMLCQGAHKGARFRVCADIRAIPLKPGFDCCLLIYDSINYLLTDQDLFECLEGVYQVLNKGGIFIFDITTHYNSLAYFSDNVQYEELEGCSVVRHSMYDETRRLQHNDFIYFVKMGQSYRRYEENHLQWVISQESMTAIIQKTSFELCGVYGDFRLKPPRRSSERIHYVLRKPPCS
jgi:ubiquinone/menaquinone biosynthesis C-methylase UbiE